jgi:hypothetical protein
MPTPAEITFAKQMVSEAIASGHPWPDYAAAEACLESWSYTSPTGQSGLAQRDKDVFGLKAPSWWTGQVDVVQTREVINGVSEMVSAKWPVFETYADAFAARLRTLQNLPAYYAEALAATNGTDFVRLVSAKWVPLETYTNLVPHPVVQFSNGSWQFDSARWSTDPTRAQQALKVHDQHPDIFHT